MHYLEIFFVFLAILGGLPIIMSISQFLMVIRSGFQNHYSNIENYYPHLSVLVPAWNEEAVLARTIDALCASEYPDYNLRVYIIDDASSDDTPQIARDKMREYPGQVFHLRREVGGGGKAHTLNFGLEKILANEWTEAVLIIDADVLFEPSTLRRMTRHLSNPEIVAVTTYIKEGSTSPNGMNRFIAYEYTVAQAIGRRGHNALSAQACLAGGAQLHRRTTLDEIGGRIDTTTLAEDTVTTFKMQLLGKVYFEGNAVVWAEEPPSPLALWKQRLRWARGNLHVTRMFKSEWFRIWKGTPLNGLLFGFWWFVITFTPLLMVLSGIGLLGLLILRSPLVGLLFSIYWIGSGIAYLLVITSTLQIDHEVAKKSWRQAILFPGVPNLAIMIYSILISPIFHLSEWNNGNSVYLYVYIWLTLSVFTGYLVIFAEKLGLKNLAMGLVYFFGYGTFLCAVTFHAYLANLLKRESKWEKTVKIGKVRVND